MALENGVLHPAVAAADLDLPLDEVEATVRDLVSLGLLRPRRKAPGTADGSEDASADGEADADADDPPAYLARSPEVAATHVAGPFEARIRQLRRHMEEATGHVLSLKPLFEQSWHGHPQPTPVEQLTSLDAIRAELERLSSVARVEVAAAHPQVPPPEALEDAFHRTVTAVGRGVLYRTLYPHAVLSHAHMRQHMGTMAELGVQYRTVGHIPDRIILYDVSTAVLADPEQLPGQGALVVRDPSLARYLYRSWESVWDAARPFTPADADPSAAPRDELRREVLRLLEAGLKDEVAARRLSMSTTTYRRHVTELVAELGAQSRFQAGSYARRAGWLDD